jgi:sugar-specific transcriptional regulator TrmB/CBS domain-containing protein
VASLLFKGTSNLSEKDITKFLHVLGLSKREIQVYIFLSKSGIQSTSYVAKKLKMERVQAYRTFKKLQEKGFIEATLERPTRFTAVSFETLLDSFINSKKSEVVRLTKQKEKLLSTWQAMSKPESTYPVSKFSVVTGKKKIHTKMKSMIEESTKEVLILTTSVGLIQEDIAGIYEEIIKLFQKRHINFQILTDVSKDNLSILERIDKNLSHMNADFRIRHLSLDSEFFPRFLIKDEEEAILYAPFGENTSMLQLEDEGLWIKDKLFISILKAFFGRMWKSAVEVARRVDELKSGIPIGETVVIQDPKEAWSKVTKVLETANYEVIFITSSQSINHLVKKDPFIKYCRKTVSCRIMAPIDLDNLEKAEELALHHDLRHVPISYMTMMVVDNQHLFIFKKPSLNETMNEFGFYLVDTFYSNDPRSTQRVSEMLNDIWKRGVEISKISSQAGMKMPTVEISTTETMSKLAHKMLKKGVNSIIITDNRKPIGMISDKELLKEIVENQKDPKRTLVKNLNYTPLITLGNRESIADAIKLLHKNAIKRIAIVKNGQLVGMLTGETPRIVSKRKKPKV